MMLVTMRIKKEREARAWSRAELARRAKMHASDIGKIESGRSTPYPVQLQRIAKALGLTLAELTSTDEAENSSDVESSSSPQLTRERG